MTEPAGGELEARVDALEARVDGLAEQLQRTTQDAVAARVLAGGADRDVGEIRGEIRDFRRATVASFNAMRDDLTDLRTQMNRGFAEMHRGFGEVDRGFAEIRGRLDATAAGIDHIAGLLTDMTRPGDDAVGSG